jgi:hypothetical protein
MKETVTVQGEPVQVESNSTQLGDVIEDRKMTALPLNGRSYLDLLGLQAGVVPISNTLGNQPQIPVSGNLAGGQLSVNGQRENANAFMVNGGDVEEVGYNGASIVPTLDSIQEFRLLTNSFDAEFGHFSGAVVNVITKAGTNSLHGTLFRSQPHGPGDRRGDPQFGARRLSTQSIWAGIRRSNLEEPPVLL